MRATCPTHLILLHYITLNLLMSTNYEDLDNAIFLQPPPISCVLGSHIPHTLFSNILTLHISLGQETKFESHTKQQVKLRFCTF
jgi:hypothetical protein